MPPSLGADFTIAVAPIASPTAFSPVADMNSFRRGSSRDVTKHSVFGRLLQYSIPGRRDQTMEIAGFLTAGDAGQNILRAAEINKTDVVMRILHDATNGFTQQCSVSAFTLEADPDGLLPYGFTLAPTADAVQVGSGPIL